MFGGSFGGSPGGGGGGTSNLIAGYREIDVGWSGSGAANLLTAESTTQSFNVGAALPADIVPSNMQLRVSAQFSGGGVTILSFVVGVAGDTDMFLTADMITVAANVYGTNGWTLNGGIGDFTLLSGAQIVATFSASGGNVSALTAGRCTVRIYYRGITS